VGVSARSESFCESGTDALNNSRAADSTLEPRPVPLLEGNPSQKQRIGLSGVAGKITAPWRDLSEGAGGWVGRQFYWVLAMALYSRRSKTLPRRAYSMVLIHAHIRSDLHLAALPLIQLLLLVNRIARLWWLRCPEGTVDLQDLRIRQ